MSVWQKIKGFFSPKPKLLSTEQMIPSPVQIPQEVGQDPHTEVRALNTVNSMWNYPTDSTSAAVTWDTTAAINEGYKASNWVYVCISRIARALKTVPWYVKQKQGNEWVKTPGHPLQKLINQPNPHWSRQDLFERCVIQMYLGGNSLIWMNKVNEVPVELWTVGPQRTQPISEGTDFISYYRHQDSTGQVMKYPADTILHLQFPDPAEERWGMAPIMAAARSIDSDVEAGKWQYNSFKNRCIVDGVFAFEYPLTKKQYDNAVEQVRNQYQGATNARTPWVLGGGTKFERMSLSPAEMDFIESKRLTREEICAIHGVPPPIVGILDKATYENIATAEEIFWLDTVLPLLDDFLDAINMGLTPLFGDPDTLRLDYDVSGVPGLRSYYLKSMDVGFKMFQMGVPFNEINSRLRLGFSRIQGGDIGYVQVNMMPVTMFGDVNADE